jgi:hypothetical protein
MELEAVAARTDALSGVADVSEMPPELLEAAILFGLGDSRTPEQDARLHELNADAEQQFYTVEQSAMLARIPEASPTIEEYAAWLKYESPGYQLDDGEKRHREELQEKYDFAGANLKTEADVADLVRRREAGETLSRKDAIAYDAALRRARPRNRHDFRHRGDRTLADLVFAPRLQPVRLPRLRLRNSRPRHRASASRRRARAPARPRRDPDQPLARTAAR